MMFVVTACLAWVPASVLAFNAMHITRSYSMNRQELIRDAASGVSAHCLIAEQNNTPQRVLHALFEGNSGGFIEFYPEQLTWNGTGQYYFPLVKPTETKSYITVSPDSLSVTSEFRLNFNAYALYSAASSIRNIRDWLENMETDKGWSENAGSFTEISPEQVVLEHRWDNDSYYVRVVLTPRTPGSVVFGSKTLNELGLQDYETFTAQLTDPAGAVLVMTTSTNQKKETPMEISDVLLPEFVDDDLAEGLAYLSHESGWVAGSWRFLTYFGRDTLMTLRMLRDKVTPDMFQNVLAAALARTRMDRGERGILENWVAVYGDDSTGLLCHEDEIGAFPWQHGGAEASFWRGDFKMLDTHFLVLPLLGYAAKSGKFDVGRFLATETARLYDGEMKTLSDLLEANIAQILRMARPFADRPAKENLLSIYTKTVGNWRDSDNGLYEAMIPMDINAAYVPASLQVIADYADAWWPGKDYGILGARYADVWKKEALEFFKVRRNKSVLEQSVRDYVASNTVKDIQGDLTAALDRSKEEELPSDFFISVGLKPTSYDPVGVLSTDYGLLLAYRDDLPEDVVAEAARAVRVMFPRGLATDAGLVVSNPAYGMNDGITNQNLVQLMGRGSYHGTVIWSWQHAMYNTGLNNYVARYPNSGVKEALNVLWDLIEGNMDMVESELWSWEIDARSGVYKAKDLLAVTGSGTEGNIAQLWSCAFVGESRPVFTEPDAGLSRMAGLGCWSLLLYLLNSYLNM